MMLLDSWNPVFRVRFENDKSLNEEFEYKEEALEYAKFHLDSKPIVEGLEVYINDLGIVTEEAEPEEIYSYLKQYDREYSLAKNSEERDRIENNVRNFAEGIDDEIYLELNNNAASGLFAPGFFESDMDKSLRQLQNVKL